MQFPCAAFLPKNVKKLPFKSLCYYFNLRLQSENVALNAQTNVKSDKKCRSNIDILCSFGNFFNSLVFLSKAIKSQQRLFFSIPDGSSFRHLLSLSIIKIAVKVQGCNAIFCAKQSRLAARCFLKVQQLQLQNILWSITKSLGKTLETTQN